MAASHRFRFFRAGGVDQVDLTDGRAIENLANLDLELWLALACPTHGLELDARTLDLIDTDHDGRIRPPEVLAAIAWAKDAFGDLQELFGKGDAMPLSALSKKTDAGKALREGARRVLESVGKPDADSIGLDDVASTEKIFEQTVMNGDGVIIAESAPDDALRQAIADALATVGSVPDRSGKPGLDLAKVDAFFAQVDAYAAWLAKADADATLRPLGDGTQAAHDAFAAVRPKVDDYFLRARLAAFDDRLGVASGPAADDAAQIASNELSATDPRIARWPIARVAPGRALPLREGINPAWSARVEALGRAAVEPLLGGRSSLAEAEWLGLSSRLDPFGAWIAAKPPLPVATLGDARVRALAASDAHEALKDLITKDAALAGDFGQIEAVEKAIRLRRDLVRFLRNFVSFADFYGKREAIFQCGTLFIDGRACELCLPVDDVAKHATLAGLSNAYLLYCHCTRKKDAEKRTIVAAVTGGEVDNLMVGRNGVFYDHLGEDWDATIARIIENPTSVRRAFWSPYKRFLRLIEQQISKRVSAAEADTHASLDSHATSFVAGTAAPAAPVTPAAVGAPPAAVAPAAAPAADGKKIDVGTVAAIGVAVGGIAAFLSSILATFLGLGMWMPLGFFAVILAISGPSMLIALLKLSQRNIGPLLDASGWAVNAFARINVPFGATLTRVAHLPKGAERVLDDPFATKPTPYRLYAAGILLGALLALWGAGKLDALLPDGVRVTTVLHRVVPGAPAKP